MARCKYQFADRAEAEREYNAQRLLVTLHAMTLDALLREEYCWTERFTADNGAWFQMGIARANGAAGGLVLVREFYPTNNKPGQHARWADGWIREMASWVAVGTMDNETRAFRDCFYALRQLYNQQAAA